jgi:hypothetical protein
MRKSIQTRLSYGPTIALAWYIQCPAVWDTTLRKTAELSAGRISCRFL